MRAIILTVSLAAALAVFWPHQAFAGAWTVRQGGMYNKLYINYFSADENFNNSGNTEAMPNGGEFTDQNIVYYGEYGLKDNITLFTSVPYKSIEFKDNAMRETTNDIGDIDLGVRYRLHEGSFVFSVQGLVKLPWAYDKDDPLPLGNGQTDVEVRLLFGKSLYPIPMYFGIEAGYRFRDGEPSDEWRYLLELGGNIGEAFYLRTKLDGTLSAKNADDALDPTGNPIATTEFDLGKLELTAGYKFTAQWIGEFTYTPNVYGKNTAAGDNLSLAVIYAF